MTIVTLHTAMAKEIWRILNWTMISQVALSLKYGLGSACKQNFMINFFLLLLSHGAIASIPHQHWLFVHIKFVWTELRLFSYFVHHFSLLHFFCVDFFHCFFSLMVQLLMVVFFFETLVDGLLVIGACLRGEKERIFRLFFKRSKPLWYFAMYVLLIGFIIYKFKKLFYGFY